MSQRQHIHLFKNFHTVESPVGIACGSSPSSHRLAQWEKPSWGAEPKFKLGPALQQADALPSELRHPLMSYAALF
jgi:hypothetical protein